MLRRVLTGLEVLARHLSAGALAHLELDSGELWTPLEGLVLLGRRGVATS